MKFIDVVVIIILAGLMAFAIMYMVKNKKAGKPFTGCSGNCSECTKRNCEKRR